MKKAVNKNEIIKSLLKVKGELKSRGVLKIGLFGSFLKGKQKKESDIDLLVRLSDVSAKDYLGLIFYLEGMFKRKVDLVLEEDLKPELKYVKKDAVYVQI